MPRRTTPNIYQFSELFPPRAGSVNIRIQSEFVVRERNLLALGAYYVPRLGPL